MKKIIGVMLMLTLLSTASYAEIKYEPSRSKISGNATIGGNLSVTGNITAGGNSTTQGTVSGNSAQFLQLITPYAQTLTVAKSGGDYTTITTALAAITDAATTKRYLIKVMPGTYVEAITMKAYVDIEGSGWWNTTITQANALGVDIISNCQLRKCSITNTASTGRTLIRLPASTLDNFIIEDCYLSQTGDFANNILLSFTYNSTTLTNVYVRNCILVGSGLSSDSVGIRGGNNNTAFFVENCRISNVSYGIQAFGNATSGNFVVKNCYVNAGTSCLDNSPLTGHSSYSSTINSYNNTYITGTLRLNSGTLAVTNSYGDTIPSVTKAAGGGTETFNSYGSVVGTPTIIAPGTTGNQTINTSCGRVNIAAAGTTVTVTNNLATANSIIMVVAATADATARVTNVVAAAGSFVINTVATTAETAFNFYVMS